MSAPCKACEQELIIAADREFDGGEFSQHFEYPALEHTCPEAISEANGDEFFPEPKC